MKDNIADQKQNYVVEMFLKKLNDGEIALPVYTFSTLRLAEDFQTLVRRAIESLSEKHPQPVMSYVILQKIIPVENKVFDDEDLLSLSETLEDFLYNSDLFKKN